MRNHLNDSLCLDQLIEFRCGPSKATTTCIAMISRVEVAPHGHFGKRVRTSPPSETGYDLHTAMHRVKRRGFW